MLATDKQINYLQQLADKVERMHKAHPGAVKCKTPYINWHTERHKGVTTLDASIRIKAYKTIIRETNLAFMLLGFAQM